MKGKKTIIFITDENNRNTSSAIKERAKGSREAQVIIISRKELNSFWKSFALNYFFKKDTSIKRFVTKKVELYMDKIPSQKVSFDVKKAIYNRMYNIFIRYNPDVVVPLVADAFPAALAARAKARKDIKIATVLDEYILDKQLVYKSLDKYIVDNCDIKEELIALGVEAEKITVAGVPVRKHFLKEMSREDALKAFDFEDKPTLLLIAARYGDEKLKKIITVIDEAKFDMNVIVACGFNRKMLSFVREKTNFAGYNEGLDMNAAYSAADAVLTRPVPSVLAESLFKKKLIFSVLPEGEAEKRTHDYLGADLAVKINSCEDLTKNIELLIKNPEEFEDKRKLIEHAVEGDPAEIILNELMSL